MGSDYIGKYLPLKSYPTFYRPCLCVVFSR